MVSLSKVFHALRPSHAPRPFRSLALQQPSPSAPPPISHVLFIIGNVRSTKISGPVVFIIIVIIIIVIIFIILCNSDNNNDYDDCNEYADCVDSDEFDDVNLFQQ